MDTAAELTARARELADPAAFAGIADPALRKVLRSYLVGGRLPVLPRAGAKRALLLRYLATAFEPGVRYRETEVNEIVRTWHPDVAALRRYLVDEGLLSRESGEYWRSGGWL
ncbi:MAG TPA: DUF2087 domain-containing protein [Jatrophihabitans sp.]|nr:DUF2087 domain-containing protein [Jatrophihabitans sp.]